MRLLAGKKEINLDSILYIHSASRAMRIVTDEVDKTGQAHVIRLSGPYKKVFFQAWHKKVPGDMFLQLDSWLIKKSAIFQTQRFVKTLGDEPVTCIRIIFRVLPDTARAKNLVLRGRTALQFARLSK